MALAVAAANRMRADLRLIATQQPIAPHALSALLGRQGLAVLGECSLFGPVTSCSSDEFDHFDGELVLAASCRCAADALAELPVEDLVCLLHADDPDLPGAVPDQAGAGALLGRTDLRFAICTQTFKQHLVGRGFTHLMRHAPSFEPTPALAVAVPEPSNDRRRAFLFEVTAPVDRERFAIGLQAIERALDLGVLDAQGWDLLFAAPDLPQVILGNGQRPTSFDHLDASAAWQARQRAVLALRLPLPNAAQQAPLGVAAPHAVVVLASTTGVNDAASAMSPAVIRCALECEAMVEALRRGVERLRDDASRPQRPVPPESTGNESLSLEDMAGQLTAVR
ncbi:MAG: hypothetical protein ABS84_03910 [Rubrivivax sp. SCN 71-131]|nr:MAG: hypothetical protein ABS84_03910 [Rubrivivax sp. SCN 71-131]